MNYIIFDLEFNQAYGEPLKNKKITKCPFEIIQIGAYKIDDTLNDISTFNALVKPSLFPEIHPFIMELTKITQDQLMVAKPFDQVLIDFSAFVGDVDNIFCVWGMGDIKELFRNIIFHQLEDQFILEKYINIQKYASKHFHLPSGKSIGLRNAVELLNIQLNKPLHDAFNDAYYTAEIFKKLNFNKIKPKSYNPEQFKNNTVNTRKPKKKIDYNGLIKQFEKMHERKMTTEEKSMIILSYKMGITHQFQVLDK